MTAGDVVLECGKILHFDIARPRKKELLWCRNHRVYEPVVAVSDGKAYRVQCDTCNYTRARDGEQGAITRATAHRVKRPHHVVHIRNSNGTIVRTFKDDEAVTTLPDLAPF